MGSGRRLVLACLAVAAVCPHPRPASGQEESAAAAREWNQPGGDPGRSCTSTMAPVRAAPVVLWRQPTGGKVISEPVTWGGTVYVAVDRGTRGRELQGWHAATGAAAGAPRGLGPGGGVDVFTWQGTVVAAERGRLRGFAPAAAGFGVGWTREIPNLGPARLDEGVLYAADGQRLWAVDARTGRLLSSLPGFEVQGPLAVGGGRVLGTGSGSKDGYEGEYLTAFVAPCDHRKWKDSVVVPVPVVRLLEKTVRPGCDLVAHVPGFGRAPGGWLVRSPVGFLGVDGDFPSAVLADGADRCRGLAEIVTAPAVHEGTLFGFDDAGSLQGVDADGKFRTLLEGDALPVGARPGPATLARDVICFGNWSVEMKSGRVLWCRPQDRPAGACVPVADGMVVFAAESGDLVCLAEPAAAERARARTAIAADRPSPARADPGPPEPPPLPTAADGVILADGTRLAGRAEMTESGLVRLLPPAGAPRDFLEDEVALAVAGGKTIHVGAEREVVRAWRGSLHAAWQRALDERLRDYLRENLLGSSRRLLEELRAWRLAEARLEALSAMLTGRSPNPSEPDRMRALMPKERDLRRQHQAAFRAAASWCRAQGLPAAAGALLADAERLLPGDAAVKEEARACSPEGFPWSGSPDAGGLWMSWAESLLPSGAAFLKPRDPAWARLGGPPWGSGSLGLRSPHLLVFTRCSDPAVVGRCLSNGEWVVRSVAALFEEPPPRPARDDGERMEVRLHRDRGDFLLEAGEGGSEHMAGYYSPAERVTRFFVPKEGYGDPLGRGLFEVLAHELTHHYLDRFRPGGTGVRGPGGPGYWCVEGIAEFVGNQVVEMDRRGLRFDDETVPSVDASARVLEENCLLPLRWLLACSQAEFQSLDPTPRIEVSLRRTLAGLRLSTLGVAYQESASLAFFLANRAGPLRRRAFLAYVRDWYRGGVPEEGWRRLGWETPEALEAEFRRWLAGAGR